jgi:hypothetical protein
MWGCLILVSLCLGSLPPPSGNPVANKAAIVEFENARFTVLTDAVIRMEFGQAEDRATFAVWNRNLPVPKFDVRRTAGNFWIWKKVPFLEMGR